MIANCTRCKHHKVDKLSNDVYCELEEEYENYLGFPSIGSMCTDFEIKPGDRNVFYKYSES